MPRLPSISRPSSKEELLLDHERLLALINSMTDGFLAVGSSGQIIQCNGVALDILDTNTLHGKSLGEALPLIDKNGRAIYLEELILSTAHSFTSRDWRFRYRDSSAINLFVSVSPIYMGFGKGGGAGYVVLLRDITKEKSIEDEREEFVSVASHELRSPVAIVEGNISNAILLSEKADVPDSVKHSLAAAHDQIIFLGNLINDLSMLSRAERGKLALEIEPFDVNKLIGSLVEDYEPRAKLKNLTLQAHVEKNIGPLISSQLYVREVLQNFITNAIKYTEKGLILVTAASKDGGVEFKVSDSGIGVGRSEQQKLFTKFFRADDWRVRKVNGSGLGLYVSGKLAQLLKGQISAHSELNQGSVFSLFAPNLEPQKPLNQASK